MSKSIASKKPQSKPAPVDVDAPIPFVPTEPASPPAGRRLYIDATDRALAAEIAKHREIRLASVDRHPDHLPLAALLSWALTGEERPDAWAVLQSLADDMEGLRAALSEGAEEQPDPKAWSAIIWNWQRRVQAAAALSQREGHAAQLAIEGGAR